MKTKKLKMTKVKIKEAMFFLAKIICHRFEVYSLVERMCQKGVHPKKWFEKLVNIMGLSKTMYFIQQRGFYVEKNYSGILVGSCEEDKQLVKIK